MTVGVINDIDSNDNARSKRSVEQDTDLAISEEAAVKKLDKVISLYDDENIFADEEVGDSIITSSINDSDTNSVASEVALQSNPIVSER